jgi:hypothetical protein
MRLSAARQLGRTPLRTTVTQAPDGTPRTAPPTLATAGTSAPTSLWPPGWMLR